METILVFLVGALLGAFNMYVYMVRSWNEGVAEVTKGLDNLTVVHKETTDLAKFYREQYLSLFNKLPYDERVEVFTEYYNAAPPVLQKKMREVASTIVLVDKSEMN